MTPSISVLIPVYNAQAYLLACLESVSAQTYTDFEIICVDDGSTDQTKTILQEYASKEPRLRFYCQENIGVAGARKKLLQHAQGQYITFIDADDWIDKEYLAVLYQKATESGADVTKCFFKQFNEKTKSFEKAACSSAFYKEVGSNDLDRLKSGASDSRLWGKLYKTKWLHEKAISFAKSNFAVEDLGFITLAFFAANKVCVVPEFLYNYRTGLPASVTSHKEWMFVGALHNRLYLCDELSERGYLTPAVADVLLRMTVGDLCRMGKLGAGFVKENEAFMCKALEYIRRYKKYCSWCGKKRMELFLFLAGKPTTFKFHFLAKLFR